MPQRRSVSILSYDLGGNALGRAYLLAKLLQDEFKVHVIGPRPDRGIWQPVRTDPTIEYRDFKVTNGLSLWLKSSRAAMRLVEGDLILAVKPLQTSFGLGLLASRVRRKPLILDIDDWEMGFLHESVWQEFRAGPSNWVVGLHSPLYTRCLDRMTGLADAVTVSNSFLQRRYGGTWIPHGRDERTFAEPVQHLEGADVIFLGTPRANKGLEDLLLAWKHVHAPGARLRIIGGDPDSDQVRALRGVADGRTRFEPPLAFSDVPAVIGQAAVVVIPQRAGMSSRGQLPAKLIDAMAAGKPIVATDVGDIGTWLAEKSGVVVEPGNPDALAAGIRKLLACPAQATETGRRARARFLRFGSFAAIRPRLVRLVADVMSGRRPVETVKAFADESAVASPGQL